jgi:hypothetical protein
MAKLYILPAKEAQFGPCECCGNRTRRVWGFARRGRWTAAGYYVEWTPGHVPDRGAIFDVVLGKWGERATPVDRVLVSLEYRLLESGPTFMVVDAAGRPADERGFVGQALARPQVIGTPWAAKAFETVDAILDKDDRVCELLGNWKLNL